MSKWFLYIGTRKMNDVVQTIINFSQNNPRTLIKARQSLDKDFKYSLLTYVPVDDVVNLRRFIASAFGHLKAKRDYYAIDPNYALGVINEYLYGIRTESVSLTHLIIIFGNFGKSLWTILWKLTLFTILVTYTLTYSILLGVLIGIILIFIFKKDD